MSTFEIVTLTDKHYIGIAVSNSFQRFDSEIMKVANDEFMRRRDEIQDTISEEEYVCPHFANDIVLTYFYCMEVYKISDVPKGMLAFTIPAQRYLKINSTEEDPYHIGLNYLQENGLVNNKQSLCLEVFQFNKRQHFNDADIYIPII